MSGSVVDGVGQTLLLSGLTEGDIYQVQLFASDNRTTSGARTQHYGDGLGNYSDTFAQNTSSYVIGSFTADSSGTQTILIEGVSDPGKQVLSGYSLRAIPEPGTYALLGGLLALGHVMVRRRR
ncbi:MAG: PEP-CTERM sorting domain-containing protein [Opitutales bacterium]